MEGGAGGGGVVGQVPPHPPQVLHGAGGEVAVALPALVVLQTGEEGGEGGRGRTDHTPGRRVRLLPAVRLPAAPGVAGEGAAGAVQDEVALPGSREWRNISGGGVRALLLLLLLLALLLQGVPTVNGQGPGRLVGVEERHEGLQGELDLPLVGRLARLQRHLVLPHLQQVEAEAGEEFVAARNSPEPHIDRSLDALSLQLPRPELADDLPEDGHDLVAAVGAGEEAGQGRPGGGREAQHCLQTGAALGQSLTRVGLGEEDGRGNPVGGRLEPEAHRHQEVLPARHGAHLVLDTLLRGVHGVLVAPVDPLQRLLNLKN